MLMRNEPSKETITRELHKIAAAMVELHPAYAGYGPSANYFRERMPCHWPKIQRLTTIMGAKDWEGVLRGAGLKVPSRGMMIDFSNAQKRVVPPWQHREPEIMLLPADGPVRCYDALPVIQRGKWGEFVRRIDDEHILIKVVTVYEVR